MRHQNKHNQHLPNGRNCDFPVVYDHTRAVTTRDQRNRRHQARLEQSCRQGSRTVQRHLYTYVNNRKSAHVHVFVSRGKLPCVLHNGFHKMRTPTLR